MTESAEGTPRATAENLNLALVGNCNFSALINERAEVVWSCMPRPDGDPVFCSLLQPHQNDGQGYYAIDMLDFDHAEQEYESNTAILETRLYDWNGNAVKILDLMPRFRHFNRMFRPTTLVRILSPLEGSPRIRIRLRPTYHYGAERCTTTHGSNHIRYIAEDWALRLTTNASLTAVLDEVPFILEHELSLVLGPDESVQKSVTELAHEYLDETRRYWHDWARSLTIPFEWQNEVIRAAITLKLNAFEDTGAVLAAVTTSIPEAPGSGRNWDYRHCWLRDAYFVINALNHLGQTQTMERYLRYIVNIAAEGTERLQPVYRINGMSNLDEHFIESLSGYRGMGPVRNGNAAYTQVQNDVYGSVVLAATHIFFDERLHWPGNEALFHRLESVGETASRVFDEPDAGIWEFRGFKRAHTFSAVMCWAACDRLARIAGRLGLHKRAVYWRRHAERIQQTIDERGWSEERGCFVGSFGGRELDASLLLLHELGFLDADDPRFAATVSAIEKELLRDGFIYRYIEEDDFGLPENAFTVCSFWYIQALADLGRRDEARELFERILACRNHVGLLSEDLNPRTGELWGNFPQTYSMVGLIKCAARLSMPWEEAF